MNGLYSSYIKEIRGIVNNHHSYRSTCLNMVAAETITSALVEQIVGSDLSRRYSSPGIYAGDKHFRKAYELTIELLSSLFKSKYINIKPATGNLAVLAIITGLAKPGDKIMRVGDNDGGYPVRLAHWAGVEDLALPFDKKRLNIKTKEAIEQIIIIRPSLIILGASKFLYPHPVHEIAEAAHDIGAVVAYDGSHVMGLIAGGKFQDPLREGADVLYGSVHKTFPGPQRGLIATNDEEIMRRIAYVLEPPPFLLSCYHLNSAVALGVAAAEMSAFGNEYAEQIVRNSKALAQGLLDQGISVFTENYGCTQSHQVILETGEFVSPEAIRIKEKLEACGIIADSVVRIGTQEVTRLGMREKEMTRISSLIADTIKGRRSDKDISEDVRTLASSFQNLNYVFENETACYDFIRSS